MRAGWVRFVGAVTMGSALFLDDAELTQLTGWKMKSRQIQWLRQNGIPFRVNATGHPVVTRSAVEARQAAAAPAQTERPRWTPKVIGA